VKAGRTLTLAQTDVFAESGSQDKLVARMTATLMSVEDETASATEFAKT
jgi:acyl-coenzyme A thioesterase PaaI-like protein